MTSHEPNRIRRVARAFREGLPMPQVDVTKAMKELRAKRLYPVKAWADASGWVHVVVLGKRRRFIVSLTRRDLVKLARMTPFTTSELQYNDLMRDADLVDMVTRNDVPSKWLGEMEEK